HPLPLLAISELGPQTAREAPEEIEERGRVTTKYGAGQGERTITCFRQLARGESLSGTTRLVLVHLVEHQEVEVAAHAAQDVVGEGEPTRPSPIGLPELSTTCTTAALLRAQLRPAQWSLLVVIARGETVGAAEEAQDLAQVVPCNPAVDAAGDPLYGNWRPPVPQLRSLPGTDDELSA